LHVIRQADAIGLPKAEPQAVAYESVKPL